jgi:hypothetical protein
MSSAFYPQGMNTQTNEGGYKTWKGNGIFSNPIATTATLIRPFTNNDYNNITQSKFGLPRPIKHYRKGTVTNAMDTNAMDTNAMDTNVMDTNVMDTNVMDTNDINRTVRSSKSVSSGLVSQLMDIPGGFSVKDTGSGIHVSNSALKIVSDWAPITNLSEKPQPTVENALFCCNQQKKALRRVLPTSTIVKKDYFQTNHMYLYNRCQTFEQREFNFVSGPVDKNILALLQQYPFISAKVIEFAKPGSPLALNNLYVAQCVPDTSIESNAEIAFMTSITNSMLQSGLLSEIDYSTLKNSNVNTIIDLINYLTINKFTDAVNYLYTIANNPYVNTPNTNSARSRKGCSQVYYKPNNPQYAKQGSVSSSTRILKLNVDTILKNAARNSSQIEKAKTPATCSQQTYIGNPFFFQGQRQKHTICN